MLNLKWCNAMGSIRPDEVRVEAQCGPIVGRRRVGPAAVRCSRPMNPPHERQEMVGLVGASSNGCGGLGAKGLMEKPMLGGGLLEDRTSYKESLMVRFYEIGINKYATMTTIANLLQEVGINHCLSMGLSRDEFVTTDTMRKLRLIWVMSRIHIEVYKYPSWGDAVEVETWCQNQGRIGIRRDWILKDLATNTVIGRATSNWLMMNQDTRKLQRVSDEVREEYLVFSPKTLRLALSEEDNGSLKKIPKLEDLAQYSRLGLAPRRADLDANKHVNHVTNIGWILESIPQEIVDTHELQTITVDYKQECQYEDIIDSLTSLELPNEEEIITPDNCMNESTNRRRDEQGCCQFLHSLRSSSSSKIEINRGRTMWRKLV